MQTAPTAPQGPCLPFVERHGGLVLSVCLHVMLFSALMILKRPGLQPEAQPEQSMWVTLSEPEPPPQPVATPVSAVATVPLEFTPAADVPSAEEKFTDQHGSGDETAWPEDAAAFAEVSPLALSPQQADPLPAQDDQTMDLQAEPMELLDPVDPASAAVLEQLAQRRRMMNEFNVQTARSGSQEVADRLRLSRVDMQAERLFKTGGQASQGVVREIDTRDADPAMVHEVLGRYGIQMLVTDQPRLGSGGGYLTRAKTSQGSFVQRTGGGKATVFRYGPLAVARMAQLEAGEIARRQLDPERVRVVHVVFGIVSTGGGWDFGIRKMETQPVGPVMPLQ